MSSTPPSAAERLSDRPSNYPAEYEFFAVVQGYLEEAARVVDLPPHIAEILSQPKNELIVHSP